MCSPRARVLVLLSLALSQELLGKYSEMNARYESLNSLSMELERDVKAQKELSVRVKEKLALPFTHAKEVDRVLMVSLRYSSELLRIMKKMKVAPAWRF